MRRPSAKGDRKPCPPGSTLRKIPRKPTSTLDWHEPCNVKVESQAIWNDIHFVEGEGLMATLAPDINCARGAMVEGYHERLLELTNIVGRRLPVFQRIALRKLNNVADAEDAVQDALLAAYTHLRQFRGQAQLSTWLTAIVINSVRMKLRRRQGRILIPLEGHEQEREEASALSESLTDRRPDPEEVYRHRELSQLLHRSVRRLSPTMRRTVQLRTVHGLSTRETADRLKVPIGTVKTHLARARKRLKELVQAGVE